LPRLQNMFGPALVLAPRPHDEADEVGDDEGREEAWLDEDHPLRSSIGDLEAMWDQRWSTEAWALTWCRKDHLMSSSVQWNHPIPNSLQEMCWLVTFSSWP
jgi:hypothetical protein